MRSRPEPVLTPVLIKACLNGGRKLGDHPALPITPAEIAADARAVRAAGAGAVHVHPRGPDATETLAPEHCAAVVVAVREACGDLPIGLTTGLWIAADPALRLAVVRDWEVLPDFVSVNFSEPGAGALCRLLLDRGVAIEAGIWSVADADALARSGLADRCLRVLVEVSPAEDADAVAEAAAIEAALLDAGVRRPQLHHGRGSATWAVLVRAIERGHDIRIGLEDTLHLPDGTAAADNAELVRTAALLARR